MRKRERLLRSLPAARDHNSRSCPFNSCGCGCWPAIRPLGFCSGPRRCAREFARRFAKNALERPIELGERLETDVASNLADAEIRIQQTRLGRHVSQRLSDPQIAIILAPSRTGTAVSVRPKGQVETNCDRRSASLAFRRRSDRPGQVAQVMNTIMRAFYFLILARDEIANRGREMILERFFIMM